MSKTDMLRSEAHEHLRRAADVKSRLRPVRDPSLPTAQGLYDPAAEKDACGVGFIADMKNRRSHAIVEKGLQILLNLDHRGAVGADPKMGDGCGILVQMPHRFFAEEAKKLGFELPEEGAYGVGHLFMPRDAEGFARVTAMVEKAIQDEGLPLLGWRDVPIDNSDLGETVLGSEPRHRQIFIGKPASIMDQETFERRLFIARKVISNAVYDLNDPQTAGYYPVCLSSRTIVYKGLVLVNQLGAYYKDLTDPRFESALALVHQRFATNTFPTWQLVHPYRMVAHNGEINTLRGNVNWMAARQASVDSELFGNDIGKLWPISYEGQSDTACFDNALEFLVRGGYSLAQGVNDISILAVVNAVAPVERADIVDRNGVLLATTVRAFTLTAMPQRVWNARETASALARLFPDLDRDATVRRLSDRSHDLVFLRRGLTPNQREAVLSLGLAGIGFAPEDRRVYPQGALAAHALGFVNVDMHALSGVELGLDQQIRSGGAEGRPVRLSIDVRIQYALEAELDVAAQAAHATSAAAILLDGRTGETLALASWPQFDPNEFTQASADARRDRVAGDVHELGSTLKPFTEAMALQERLTTSGELFDLSQPFDVDGSAIVDDERILGPASLRDILARSSNIGAARLALRIGADRQRTYLTRLGLLSQPSLELARSQAPIAPVARTRRDIAGLGFGYGLAATPASLAGAYTIFANNGARVTPTLLVGPPDAHVTRTPVFSPTVTQQVLSYMRSVVTDGTGRAADVPGLQMAGKTGTAEKLDGETYNDSRNFSSFAGVFPATNPRYVIVLALDDTGAGEAGGAVAAPAVARIAERIAPMLGLRVEPRAAAH